ncbi:X-linked retinitis pigmentosa GTPase regulator-like isoform X2 [Dunckerocampus dactyliophorus]|uniref:X-linked retinitis pigmentosa GTPase regulator-like isoform X2 n=1 Tax=Dunckerocampus dactyliophorus TaxID=161453 RepID=UPI002405EAF6|nr:X-linked retinitis pigmentosa GTPase regulator-like isoform X2 [Dunckerocampus dactyliophorus]
MDLLCWGNGDLGQTGHGGTGDITPEDSHLGEFTEGGLGRVKLMACGSAHSVVVTADNKIFVWGNGTSGQLGNGERTVKYQPVEITLPLEENRKGSDDNVQAIKIAGVACGSRHSFIWTKTGLAYSFGNNYYAQLGYDFQRADYKEHQLAPRLFRSLPSSLKISQVACGERHTLFALQDGRVAACGHNDCGQIGSGSDENVIVPHFVQGLDHVSKVTCGANHSLALTGDGRLFQWGCGRACGNTKKNILYPQHVMLQSSPVKEIAAGCWHSLLLTDGGNVFSWGMGQEGQLGLGEKCLQMSNPCLLSYSHLVQVTRIQAGDSYSAAVTAGGELLLWGQVPRVSQLSEHPSHRRIWIPQLVPLFNTKVSDVASGTWHVMALATRSSKKERDCAQSENDAPFRDHVRSTPLTEHTTTENTIKGFRQVGLEERKKEDEEESDERERANSEEALKERAKVHVSAFNRASSVTRTGSRLSTIKSGLWEANGGTVCLSDEGRWKEGYKKRGSKEIVFTTLHLLPTSVEDPDPLCPSILPRLQPRQQQAYTDTGKEREKCLSTIQKSGSDNRILSQVVTGLMLRPQPRPPGRRAGFEDGNVASCHGSSVRLHCGHKSPVYSSPLLLRPEEQVLVHPVPPVEDSFSQTSSRLCR